MAFRKGKFQSAHVREPSIFFALRDLLDHLGESIQSKAVNLGWLTGRNYLFVRSPIRDSYEEEEGGKVCDRISGIFGSQGCFEREERVGPEFWQEIHRMTIF